MKEFLSRARNRLHASIGWTIVMLAVLLSAASAGCTSQPVMPQQSETTPQAANWNMEQGWQWSKIDSEIVMEGKGHSWATLEDEIWPNFQLRAGVNIVSGTVHINFRLTETDEGVNRYIVGVSRTSLYLQKQTGNEFVTLSEEAIDLNEGWHDIEITVFESSIEVKLDGQTVIALKDDTPHTGDKIALESLDDTTVLIRALELARADQAGVSTPTRAPQPTPDAVLTLEQETIRMQDAVRASFYPDEIHEGDLVLRGDETLVIEGKEYLQLGNVYLNDRSKLIIRDSTFMLGRGDVPTVHVYINVAEGATLQIERSTVIEKAESGAGMLVVIRNHGTTNIFDSPTEIHLLEQYDGTVEIRSSLLINEIGGLLQIVGGDTHVTDSTLGALAFLVPTGADLKLDGLRSGVFLEAWDIRDWMPEAGYSVLIERTMVLEDNLDAGPFERGWLLFADEGAHIRLTNSELRKIFIEVNRETAEFDQLKINQPVDFSYKDISLSAVTVTGQWPITIRDADVTIRNAEYLFLQPSGKSHIVLSNAHVVEFIPRAFFGTIEFDNCIWTNAGEIIGGESYHSTANDFTMIGSLTTGPDLRNNLQWQDARVTREYTLVVTNQNGSPIEGLSVQVGTTRAETDENGEAVFRLKFDETNYNQPAALLIYAQSQLLHKGAVDFFTTTPIRIDIRE